MKKLSDILYQIELVEIIGNSDIEINKIQFDSRKITNGDLFIAISGTAVDGHTFIESAVNLGAKAVICEHIPYVPDKNVVYIKVKNAAEALGIAARNFYNISFQKIKIIGVTGTNGKTTIATLLYNLVRKLGKKAGLISTVCYYVEDKKYDSSHTTPDSLRIQELFAEMIEEGCEYCFMEVSSHSVVQGRIAGIEFTGGIFTNLTHDHLDYHKTFNEYLKAKKSFFDSLSAGSFSIINKDDKNGSVMAQNTKSIISYYSLFSMANYKARILESHIDGTLAVIDGNETWTPFIGKFNIYNLLAVYACALKLGFESVEVLKILSGLKPVEGRFEYIKSGNGKTAIVDYAHTPDALENVLNALNEIRTGNEQLITVVGAGGNRDKTKRPKMADVSVKKSDKLILTSDNPRFEDPEEILKDMISGISREFLDKYLVISDRREAIKTAIMMANPNDIILIAGKGHETYQEVKGVRTHFDDREVVKEFFNIK